MWAALSGIISALGPIIVQILIWFGYTQEQAADFLSRISKAQGDKPAEPAADEESEAEAELKKKQGVSNEPTS